MTARKKAAVRRVIEMICEWCGDWHDITVSHPDYPDDPKAQKLFLRDIRKIMRKHPNQEFFRERVIR